MEKGCNDLIILGMLRLRIRTFGFIQIDWSQRLTADEKKWFEAFIQ